MKNKIAVIGAVCLAAVILSGCVGELKNKVVYNKSTFFGFRVLTANPTAATPTPTIEFGLARDEWLSLPTGSNIVYVAPFNEHARANLTAIRQTAVEGISTLPTNTPEFFAVATNAP
jgi:hypothetical protein